MSILIYKQFKLFSQEWWELQIRPFVVYQLPFQWHTLEHFLSKLCRIVAIFINLQYPRSNTEAID